jgi:hypothetical protein
MATVHTILTPTAKRVSFTGGTDAQRLIQGAARGEERYFESTASNWPASGAGDNRSLAVTISLDRDYSWVITDLSAVFMKIGEGDTLRMDAVAMVEIALPVPGGYEYTYTNMTAAPSRQSSSAVTPVGDIPADKYNSQHPLVDSSTLTSMTFVAPALPTYQLYPFDNTNNTVDFTCIFSEAVNEQVAYTCRFAARFIQYDISQGYDWRVQSPLLTR